MSCMRAAIGQPLVKWSTSVEVFALRRRVVRQLAVALLAFNLGSHSTNPASCKFSHFTPLHSISSCVHSTSSSELALFHTTVSLFHRRMHLRTDVLPLLLLLLLRRFLGVVYLFVLVRLLPCHPKKRNIQNALCCTCRRSPTPPRALSLPFPLSLSPCSSLAPPLPRVMLACSSPLTRSNLSGPRASWTSYKRI